jgi:hypothetical protein
MFAPQQTLGEPSTQGLHYGGKHRCDEQAFADLDSHRPKCGGIRKY